MDFKQTLDGFMSLPSLQGVSEEKKLELVSKLLQVLLKRVLDQALETLSEQEQAELEKLMEEKGDEEMFNYLDSHVPGFRDMVDQEAKNLASHVDAVLGVE